MNSGCIDEEAIYILEKKSTNNIQLAKRFELLDSRKQGITEIIIFQNFKFYQINFQYLLNLTL